MIGYARRVANGLGCRGPFYPPDGRLGVPGASGDTERHRPTSDPRAEACAGSVVEIPTPTRAQRTAEGAAQVVRRALSIELRRVLVLLIAEG